MKKLLALLLGLAMMFSVMPATFADGEVLPGTIALSNDGVLYNCDYEKETPSMSFGASYSTKVSNPKGDGNVLKIDMSSWTSGDVDANINQRFVQGNTNYFSYDVYVPAALENKKNNNVDKIFCPAIYVYTSYEANTTTWLSDGKTAMLRWYHKPGETETGYYYYSLPNASDKRDVTLTPENWYRVIYEFPAAGTYVVYVQNLSTGGAPVKLGSIASGVLAGVTKLQLMGTNSFVKNVPVHIDNAKVYTKKSENAFSVASFGTGNGLAAALYLTDEVESADVYLEDTKIAEAENVTGGEYTLTAPWDSLGIKAIETCRFTLNCYDAEGNVIDEIQISKTPSVEVFQNVAISSQSFNISPANNGTSQDFLVNVNSKGVIEHSYEFNAKNINKLYVSAYMYDENGNRITAWNGMSGDTYRNIINNGIVMGTSTAINPEKWYRVKVRFDSINKTVSYWVANEGEEFSANPTVIGNNNGTGYIGLYYFKFNYSIASGVSAENPATFNVRNNTVKRIYTLSDIGTELLAAGTESDAISLGTVAFDEGLANNVTVKKDGVTLNIGTEVTVAHDFVAKTLTVTPVGGFAANSKYTVEIAKEASIGGATNVLSVPVVKEYLVYDSNSLYLGDIEIAEAGDKYTGSFEYANNAQEDKVVTVIMVSYNGNRVNSVSIKGDIKLKAGANEEVGVYVSKSQDDTQVRAFIWEALESLAPISVDSVDLTQQ